MELMEPPIEVERVAVELPASIEPDELGRKTMRGRAARGARSTPPSWSRWDDQRPPRGDRRCADQPQRLRRLEHRAARPRVARRGQAGRGLGQVHPAAGPRPGARLPARLHPRAWGRARARRGDGGDRAPARARLRGNPAHRSRRRARAAAARKLAPGADLDLLPESRFRPPAGPARVEPLAGFVVTIGLARPAG